MKKIGIFSGTFDPVHDGHLAMAHTALRQLSLDKIFFLVEPRPRRKQGVRALEHRIAMTQLAIADEAKFGCLVLNQARFTAHETMPLLTARFGEAELYLLMGDDMLSHLISWPHVDELLQSVHFVIARRRLDIADATGHLEMLQATKGVRVQYDFVEPSRETVSSQKIRQSLRHGFVPEGLSSAVHDYIATHRLYRAQRSLSTKS